MMSSIDAETVDSSVPVGCSLIGDNIPDIRGSGNGLLVSAVSGTLFISTSNVPVSYNGNSMKNVLPSCSP